MARSPMRPAGLAVFLLACCGHTRPAQPLTGRWWVRCAGDSYAGIVELEQAGQRVTGRGVRGAARDDGAFEGTADELEVRLVRSHGSGPTQTWLLRRSGDGRALDGVMSGAIDPQVPADIHLVRLDGR